MTRIAIALILTASTLVAAAPAAFAEKKQEITQSTNTSRVKSSDKAHKQMMDFIKS